MANGKWKIGRSVHLVNYRKLASCSVPLVRLRDFTSSWVRLILISLHLKMFRVKSTISLNEFFMLTFRALLNNYLP
jgi:hypothetical protein